MAQAERTQRYRPEIDGLRAIAVLAVVLFHAGVDYLPGGFVGVDVFFVISGYLITRNIVQMLADGTFTFRNFYLRRTKRLLPAATVTTLTTLSLGAWFLTPDAWIDLSESAIASALFVANFWFAQNSGYFDQATELSALVHMWSLAVEEQFYLLAPPALYVAYRRFGLAGVRWTVGVILAGSFSLSVGLSEGYPNESFYLLHTRAWELALGAAVALFPSTRISRPLYDNLIASLGFFLMGLSLVLVNSETVFPGVAAAAPTLGAALLLMSVREHSTVFYPLLTCPPLRWLGRISYSVYLWHWPIIVYYRVYVSDRDFTWLETALLVVCSVGAGFVSWHQVEERFRHSHARGSAILAYATLSVLLSVVVAAHVLLQEGYPNRLSTATRSLIDRKVNWRWECTDTLPSFAKQETEFCVVGERWLDAAQKGILWGDSHSMHWAPLFDYLGKRYGVSFVIGPLSCPSFLNEQYVREDYTKFPRFTEECTNKQAETIRWLEANGDVGIIVMAAAWVGHARRLRPVEPESGALKLSVRQRGGRLTESALRRTLLSLPENVERSVLLLGDVPRPGWNMNPCAYQGSINLLRAPCKESHEFLPAKKIRATHGPTDRALRSIADEFDDVRAIIPVSLLCDETLCPTYINGEFIYRDSNHIRRNLKPDTVLKLVESLGLDKWIEEALP